MANALDITVGILNWQRPANMQRVVESVAKQSCKPAIWLWDNNPTDTKQGDWLNSIDVTIQSSRNLGCGVWASMMALCQSEFIAKIDDDLAMLDNDVLGDCIEYLRDRDHDMIIGICGVALDPTKPYPNGKWHTDMPQRQDLAVDVPKGRFHVVRRSALMKTPYAAIGHNGDVSWPGFLAGDRRLFHCVPGFLHKRLENLYEGAEAASMVAGHYSARERVRRQWFSW